MDARCSQCGHFAGGPLVEKAFDIFVPSGTHYTLLNSNEPPDDSESRFIRSVVSDADARLAWLDDEISKIQEKLRRSEEERVSLFSYRERTKAMLSPLRRMPPEVLGETFSWTLPSVRESWAREEYTTGSPWVLSHISSRWRAIALSTPSLWSLVVINYNRTVCSVSAIEAQIHRARDLKIHFHGCEEVDSRPQIQMFQLLLRHSSRWEELSLALTADLVPLLTALSGRLPLLQRLWIEWNSPESQAAVQSVDCFQVAPSLVDLGIFNRHRFIPITLPIHQLTRYQFDGPWFQHETVLRLAQNLVEAHITVIFDDEPWPESNGLINLSRVRRLYISDPQLLGHLKAPALEELAFNVYAEDIDATAASRHLQSFLDSSDCPLRRLGLRGSPETHETTEILGKVPFITELAIEIDDADTIEQTNHLMSALTISQGVGSTAVAPQLRSVALGCEEECDVDYTKYLKMLESRWRAEDCPLDTAVLAAEGVGPDPETLDGLRALRGEGLNLLLIVGEEAIDEIERWGCMPSWC